MSFLSRKTKAAKKEAGSNSKAIKTAVQRCRKIAAKAVVKTTTGAVAKQMAKVPDKAANANEANVAPAENTVTEAVVKPQGEANKSDEATVNP